MARQGGPRNATPAAPRPWSCTIATIPNPKTPGLHYGVVAVVYNDEHDPDDYADNHVEYKDKDTHPDHGDHDRGIRLVMIRDALRTKLPTTAW